MIHYFTRAFRQLHIIYSPGTLEPVYYPSNFITEEGIFYLVYYFIIHIKYNLRPARFGLYYNKVIKIEMVKACAGGTQHNGEGNSTSNFISGLYRSVPPLTDLLNMAGMELPEYMGKKQAAVKTGTEEKK